MSILKYITEVKHFILLTDKLIKPLMVSTVIAFGVGLYYSIFNSPADYQQSDTVRIMYVHVPAAWMSMFCYLVIAVNSLLSLIYKNQAFDIYAKSSSKLVLCLLLLR